MMDFTVTAEACEAELGVETYTDNDIDACVERLVAKQNRKQKKKKTQRQARASSRTAAVQAPGGDGCIPRA